MAKSYTAQIKFQVVMQVLTGEKSIAQIAKEQSIHPNSINKWFMKFFKHIGNYRSVKIHLALSPKGKNDQLIMNHKLL